MGIESPVHLLFIAIVALIVLGPKRLPGLARALGQGIREFRSSLEAGAEPAEPEEPPTPPAQPHQALVPAPPAQSQQAESLAETPAPPAEPPAVTASAVAEAGERPSGQENGAERPRESA